MRTVVSRPDLADPVLAARWQGLAAGAGATVFQSWSWVGSLAAERYPDPLLVETFAGDTLIGLALFNRRRTWWSNSLHLHESGDPAQDGIFVEHNGPVSAPGRRAGVWDATLRAIGPVAGRIVLSGIDDAGLSAVRAQGGLLGRLQTRLAPYAAIDPAGPPFIETLSRNTRAQLRRSDRAYAGSGPIRVERATTPEQAARYLAEMLRLHAATWEARGIASAFTSAPVQRFHAALIARCVPTGEVDLLRISAGARLIGVLLNLRAGGRVAAYQSGFDYAGAGPHEKPGLTCHHAAIDHARRSGAVEYDFLAGDSQYKRSLGAGVRAMHWLTWRQRPGLYRAVPLMRRLIGR